MESDDKQTSGLPNGFGFTRETVKYRTDNQIVEQRTDDQTVEQQTDDQTVEQRTDDQTVEQRTDDQIVEQRTADQTVKQRTDIQTVKQWSNDHTIEQQTDDQTVEQRTDDQTVEQRTDDQIVEQRTDDQTVKQRTDIQTVKQWTDDQIVEQRTDDQIVEQRTDDQTVKQRTDIQTVKQWTDDQTVEQRTDDQTVKQRTDDQTVEQRTDYQTIKQRTDDQTVKQRTDDQTVKQRTDDETVKHRTDDQTVKQRTHTVKQRTDDQIRPCCKNGIEIHGRVGDNGTSSNSVEGFNRTCSIEIDTLCAHRVLDQTFTPNHQPLIPEDFIDCKPSQQPSAPRGILFKTNPKPGQSSEILIPHEYQTDTDLGDFFGATLCTYSQKSGSNIEYQHILTDIKEGFPAKSMRICEGDELVLIGETFTPAQDHDAVINTFKDIVKVDGTSRFALVLRKLETQNKKRCWYWYETSAILAPDHKGHRSPDVLQPHCAAVDEKRYVHQIVYEIPCDSSLYMFIDESGIRAVHTEANDHSVYVNKIILVSFTPKGFTLQKALCGKDNTSYVRMDEQKNVCIGTEPTWFDEGKHVGNDDSFGTNGHYMVFDRISQKFAMVATCDNQQTVEIFRGFTLDSTDDACALRTTSYSEHGYGDSFRSPENNERTHHDVVPQSPICLSFENLEIDFSMIIIEENEGEEQDLKYELEEEITG
ncbi:uncharacterized protein LOC127833535 isoform X2 [Dreissena polymorpha]|uniref:Uncharacterized protein n=2 Tax=Dreissena polymorpha TaxID=45954 RepID=A0A9D4G979_DREPO|nr:uncharacterized protein LOC127833535 isoform X2 [Dreissena polymorpha]KAH3809762.1 hypothetical protein DPMN_138140 [Dreissena polymorpha]